MASTWWFQPKLVAKTFNQKTSFQKASTIISKNTGLASCTPNKKKHCSYHLISFSPIKTKDIKDQQKPFFPPSFPANPSKPPCAVLPSGSTGRIMAFLPVPHPLLRRHWFPTKRISVKFYNRMGWKQSHRIHGIFTYIRMISIVIVGKYAIHGDYGNKKVHTKIVNSKIVGNCYLFGETYYCMFEN